MARGMGGTYGTNTGSHPSRQVSRPAGDGVEPAPPAPMTFLQRIGAEPGPYTHDPSTPIMTGPQPLDAPGPTTFYPQDEPDEAPETNYVFTNFPWGLATMGEGDYLDKVMNKLNPPLVQS